MNEYGPIVIDWNYQYREERQNETDTLLSDWFQYYRDRGEFEMGVESLIFAHIDGGIRHVTIFRDPEAFIMHAQNTARSPLASSDDILYSDWSVVEGKVYGLPVELESLDYVTRYLPEESTEYIAGAPDIWRWGPHLYGLLNEPLIDRDATGGSIVINFSYRYKSGMQAQIDTVLNDLTAYYSQRNEFGTLLKQYQLTAFEGGFTLVQVFTDARAFEIHVNNTLDYPDQSGLALLATGVEVIGSYVVGLPSEIAKAPTIAEIYPEILKIEGLPVLKPYGSPFFGWQEFEFSNGFNKLYVVLPILDLVAGLWNANTWNDLNDAWRNTYIVEIGTGVFMFAAWATLLQQPISKFFQVMTRIYIILEIVNLFLVYNADQDISNWQNNATEFSYFAHAFNLMMSIAYLTYESVQFTTTTPAATAEM